MNEKKKNNLKFILVISILLSLIFIPLCVKGFEITTDETTETSIIWNLSALPNTTNISAIALDGIMLEGYIPNPKQIVQNNLYAGETHLIIVLDDSGNESTGEATTIIPSISENEKLAAKINLYFIFFIVLICALVGLFIPIVGLSACVFSIIGLLTSVNNSFAMGFIFFIGLIIGIIEAMSEWSG